MTVKSLPIIFFTGAVWLALSAIAHGAQGTGEPARRRAGDYQLIVERNPFGLKPVTATVTTNQSVTLPSPTVRLVGIARVSGQLKAYLVLTPAGKAVGEYVNLSPGETLAGLELTEIDTTSTSVTVRLDGKTKALTLQNDAGGNATKSVKEPVPGA